MLDWYLRGLECDEEKSVDDATGLGMIGGGQIYVHFMNACWSNQNHESASTEGNWGEGKRKKKQKGCNSDRVQEGEEGNKRFNGKKGQKQDDEAYAIVVPNNPSALLEWRAFISSMSWCCREQAHDEFSNGLCKRPVAIRISCRCQ